MTDEVRMDRHALGANGPTVSAIGLGLAALGRPGYITAGRDEDLGEDRSVEALRSATWVMLDEAARLGITYLDAARSYGRAEEFLAGWWDERSPQPAPVVGSKWGYVYTADWAVEAPTHEVKIHTLENLERQLDDTRVLLDRRLAVYQIHSATLDSGVLDDRAVLGRLARLRDDGVLVGASTSGPDQAATIRALSTIEVDGRRLFDTVQATWNLLEPSADDALADAADAGLGVIVKEVVANGRLTPRNTELSDRLRAVVGDAALDTVATAAALARPWASVVLSGAVTTQQLRSHVAAVTTPRAVVDALPDLAQAPDEYWSARSGRPWR